MKNKTLKDFAIWLGLEVGHKYKIGIEGKSFIISKNYNVYYDDESIGYSLYSFSLNDLLNNLIEIK